MQTNSPCFPHQSIPQLSKSMRSAINTIDTFVPAPSSEIDLSLYQDLSEIYREVMAPTCVYTASKSHSHEKIAIKKIFKEELVNDFQRTQAAQEFPLHCALDHENIVKGYEWSETSKEYILIMEYMNNADYFKAKIETRLSPVKNEEKLKSYASDILEGLCYLHSRGIVHGDIKLENLLVKTAEDDSTPIVKLCDFGLSRFLDKTTGTFLMTIPVGSVSYMAPEIKTNAYVNEKIDIWSLGVVLYKMSVAYKPTQISGYKYGDGPIPFRRVDWRKKSKELQDLIMKMLEPNIEKRLSAKEALEHPWFQV